MSRFVVAGCSAWCKIGAFRQLCFTRIPLKHNAAYRHSRPDKGFRKLHRRVLNEHALQEQLDIMKQSVVDLDSADSFGSLSIDCDVDEELKYLLEADQPVSTSVRKSRKFPSSEVSEEHSRKHSDRQVTGDVQQDNVKGSRQPVSKHSHEHRITTPLEVSNQTAEHLKVYSGKKSLPDVRPGHKDWSKKFGTLSDDVDKFLDKYAEVAKRYSCHIFI